jgi:hypothetical protein
VNEAGTQNGWPQRLELHGFVAKESAGPHDLSPAHIEQIEHTLRWLLRRFVDPEWIDARLSRPNRE